MPPAETGAEMLHEGTPVIDTDAVIDPTFVYCVNDRDAASIFAAVHRGWLYEVEPDGDIEDDPDFVPDESTDVRSIRCGRARILRREKLSNREAALIAAAFASEAFT